MNTAFLTVISTAKLLCIMPTIFHVTQIQLIWCSYSNFLNTIWLSMHFLFQGLWFLRLNQQHIYNDDVLPHEAETQAENDVHCNSNTHTYFPHYKLVSWHTGSYFSKTYSDIFPLEILHQFIIENQLAVNTQTPLYHDILLLGRSLPWYPESPFWEIIAQKGTLALGHLSSCFSCFTVAFCRSPSCTKHYEGRNCLLCINVWCITQCLFYCSLLYDNISFLN